MKPPSNVGGQRESRFEQNGLVLDRQNRMLLVAPDGAVADYAEVRDNQREWGIARSVWSQPLDLLDQILEGEKRDLNE